MRLRHPTGRIVHLGYAITPRPARHLPALVTQLDTYATARARLGADRLGVDVWLPPGLAAALAVEGRARTRLRTELEARCLEVVTLSGAPFAPAEGGTLPEGGGEDNAELDVPAWNEPARREYTLDLARVLVDLLPEDSVRGAIRTTGIAPADGWNEAREKSTAGILRRLSAGLADLAWQNGRAVRVGFQPGPGLVLDTPEGTVAALSRTDKDRLGVTLDLAHAAGSWPDAAAGIDTLLDAGQSLVSVRVTAAPGRAVNAWRGALGRVFGPSGPLVEYLTITPSVAQPNAEQVANDIAYVLAELTTLGVVPENEPCPAR